jgi:hypothetical protein
VTLGSPPAPQSARNTSVAPTVRCVATEVEFQAAMNATAVSKGRPSVRQVATFQQSQPQASGLRRIKRSFEPVRPRRLPASGRCSSTAYVTPRQSCGKQRTRLVAMRQPTTNERTALLQDQKHCKKHRKLIRQGLVRLYASTHTYSPTHHASCTLISLTCTAHSYMIATCRIGLLQVLAPHSPCESPYPLGVCARCNLSRALFLPALRREHTARSSRGSSSSVTTRVTTRARLRTTGKTGHASSRGVCVPSVCVPMHRVRSPPVVDAAGPEQSRGCSLWSFLSTALGEKLKRHSRGMTAGLTAGVLTQRCVESTWGLVRRTWWRSMRRQSHAGTAVASRQG